MKLRGIKVSETVCSLLYRSRLAEVTWESFSIVSLILSCIWHVGRDIDQSGNRWIRPGFSNYGSPIAVSDKNARSILLSKDPLGRGDIFFKGRLRLLDDADIVTILNKNVVNAFPAGTICPGTVNQNNIPNARLLRSALRVFGRSAAVRQCKGTEKFPVPPPRYIFEHACCPQASVLRISYYGVAVGFFCIAYGGMWALSLEIEAGRLKSEQGHTSVWRSEGHTGPFHTAASDG